MHEILEGFAAVLTVQKVLKVRISFIAWREPKVICLKGQGDIYFSTVLGFERVLKVITSWSGFYFVQQLTYYLLLTKCTLLPKLLI